MTKEDKVLHLLVKKLDGHSVTIIREGVGELVGFSVGKGRSIAIDDLIAVVHEKDAEIARMNAIEALSPQPNMVTISRDRLLKLLEYADEVSVPNSLFEEFRGYLNTLSLQSNVEPVAWQAKGIDGIWRYVEMPRTAAGMGMEIRGLVPVDTPAPQSNGTGKAGQIADAIEACDWSGCSIGNKEILKSAVALLRSLT